MKPNSIFIVGCGDLGVRIERLLDKSDFCVTGVCRRPAALPKTLTGITADYSQNGSLSFLAGAAPDYLVLTLKPLGMSAEGYQLGFPNAVRNVLSGLGSHRPKAIFMVSSTRVFAEQNGGWVDEDGVLAQEGYAAQAIIEAEQMLQNSGHKVCIVRFGGIYGGAGGRMLERIRLEGPCDPEPLKYSNRIHRDDCAGVVTHLLGLDCDVRAQVYIAVDDEPAPQSEVEKWLAGQMGVDRLSTEAAAIRSAGHKRCSNRRLKQSGYILKYPNYRFGYGAVLASSS